MTEPLRPNKLITESDRQNNNAERQKNKIKIDDQLSEEVSG